MLAEEEERITADDEGGQLTATDISHEATKGLKKRLGVMLKPTVDQKFDYGNDRLYHDAGFDVPTPPIYGDFLASHSRPIAGVSLNANKIFEAAREDVANHGGKGHHFRGNVMDLVPGVGPQEASHAWLLLQPHTSELGVIDPALAAATLDHKGGEIPNRDYFKYERQLAAGRDAAGYNHVPLGQFSHGLYDNVNFGHGVHRDYQPLKPVDPMPHDQVDWSQYSEPSGTWDNPYWWQSTEEARNQIGRAYDEAIGTTHPQDEIPYRTARTAEAPNIEDFAEVWRKYVPVWPQEAAHLASRAKLYGLTRKEAETFIDDHKDDFRFDRVRKEFKQKFFESFGKTGAVSAYIPWFIHEGEQYEGQPGQSMMEHARNSLGLSTEEIWARIESAGLS